MQYYPQINKEVNLVNFKFFTAKNQFYRSNSSFFHIFRSHLRVLRSQFNNNSLQINLIM